MFRLKLIILIWIWPALALAEASQGDAVSRAIELPAHRVLLERITSADAVLAPFSTDGCSGGLSSVWRLVSSQLPAFEAAHHSVPPWETCCTIHDQTYHPAGNASTPEDSFAARLKADRMLRQCVIETGATRQDELASHYGVSTASIENAYAVIAQAMYLAVRFGGAPCSGMPWRWGYGWPDCYETGAIDGE